MDDHQFFINLWKPPPLDLVKLTTDGSFRDMANCMEGGGMLRDFHGCWICGFMSHNNDGNMFLAEALTLLDGLQIAWKHGHRRILCKVDCTGLIQVLRYEDRWRLHEHAEVLGEIHELLNRSWRCSMNWISRDGNCPTDYLARRGGFSSSSGVRELDAPPPEG